MDFLRLRFSWFNRGGLLTPYETYGDDDEDLRQSQPEPSQHLLRQQFAAGDANDVAI